MLRLQDMEIQYRREKEEADLLLEQHRLVRAAPGHLATWPPPARWPLARC